MLGPKELLSGNRDRTVHHQVAFVADPDPEPRQRLRRRPLDLDALYVELAAVAGAGDQILLRRPDGQAAQMRTHRRERVNTLGAMNDVDAGLRIGAHRALWVTVGFTSV